MQICGSSEGVNLLETFKTWTFKRHAV